MAKAFSDSPVVRIVNRVFVALLDAPLVGALVRRGLIVIRYQAGRACGVIGFMRMDPANGVIEIGHIWFGGRIQRSPIATEAIYLAARYAFDDLGNRRLEWKCNNDNARSKRAAARFGFQFEGVFRQHSIARGRNRDTAWFAIIDADWPAVQAAFEAWLAPVNFDADGVQRQSLEALRTT